MIVCYHHDLMIPAFYWIFSNPSVLYMYFPTIKQRYMHRTNKTTFKLNASIYKIKHCETYGCIDRLQLFKMSTAV